MLHIKKMLTVGLCLMPMGAYALTPVGEIESPDGVPDQTPSWQYFDAERGDVHWTYAETYAEKSGIAEQGASTLDVMRLIKNMPQNEDVEWVPDTVTNSDGEVVARYPAFKAGQRYYLPVIPDVEIAGTLAAESQLASYEASVSALRAEMVEEQQRLAGLVATLTERIATGETVAASANSAIDAVQAEIARVRESIPGEVNLRPIEDSLAALTAAVANIEAGTFTDAMMETLAQQVRETLGTLPETVAELEAGYIELDGRITAEAEVRASGDAALSGRIDGVLSNVSTLQGRVNELSTQFSELAMPDISGVEAEIGAVSDRLGTLEGRFNNLEYATPAELDAAEAEISAAQVSLTNLTGRFDTLAATVAEQGATLAQQGNAAAALDGRVTGIADDVTELRTDFESAQAYPLRWLYAPLGLSEWYEAKPGLGNFSAAGVTLVLLAMLAVALRGLFPGRDSKLAKNLNRQLNGDKGEKGLVATVDSHEDRLKVVEERVGTVEDKTEVLEQLALQDIDFDEDNANLGDLQSGEENAVVWKIFKKGDATRFYQVTIGRLADTPSGQVFTDIPRKKGGEPVNTPFAIATLELKILKAINDGRLEPVLLKPSLNGSADTSRHVN